MLLLITLLFFPLFRLSSACRHSLWWAAAYVCVVLGYRYVHIFLRMLCIIHLCIDWIHWVAYLDIYITSCTHILLYEYIYGVHSRFYFGLVYFLDVIEYRFDQVFSLALIQGRCCSSHLD